MVIEFANAKMELCVNKVEEVFDSVGYEMFSELDAQLTDESLLTLDVHQIKGTVRKGNQTGAFIGWTLGNITFTVNCFDGKHVEYCKALDILYEDGTKSRATKLYANETAFTEALVDSALILASSSGKLFRLK